MLYQDSQGVALCYLLCPFRAKKEDKFKYLKTTENNKEQCPSHIIGEFLSTNDHESHHPAQKNRTIEFLGIWEEIYNPDFNSLEFEGIKNQAGLNRFTLSVKQWTQKTKSKGIVAKAGRYGGTYAHKDIAFEFASWISPQFKLYLIKEFQRLKEEERKQLGWDIKRNLAKINYQIHTDSIKEHLIPEKLTKKQINNLYASEADILNMALFGMTAKNWRDKNPDKKGNIRDYATISQLVCLSNLENLNALFINERLSQKERLEKLNKIAIHQMKILVSNKSIKKIENN